MGIELVDVLHGVLAIGLLIGPIVAMSIAEHPHIRRMVIYSQR